MALNGFKISNEGPIDKVRCSEVPDLMVIAGPNGSGKSTILEAIRSACQNPSMSAVVDVPRGGINCVYYSPYRAPWNRDISQTTLHQMRNLSSREVLSKHNLSTKDVSNGSSRRDIPGKPYSERSRSAPDFLPYYEVKRRMAQFDRTSRDYTYETYQEKSEVPSNYIPNFEEPLEKAVSQVLPGIELDGVEKEEGIYRLHFTNRDGKKIGFDSLSSGEQDVVSLLFFMVEEEIIDRFSKINPDIQMERDSIVLIDSPESHLHPQLQFDFLEYIQDYLENTKSSPETQVIITTHSKAIIENVARHQLFYLVYPDGNVENQLQKASDISSNLEELVNDDLGLTALSAGKSILLVEGPTDKEVLRRIDPSLKENLNLVELNGKDSVIKFGNTFEQVLPELQQTGIEIFALVDKDRDTETSNGEITKRIHQIPATCIENLLLKPSALSKVITDVLGEENATSLGFQSSKSTKNELEELAVSEEFVSHETHKRWNESVNPLNISAKGFLQSEFKNIDKFAEKCTKKRLERSESIDSIEQKVERIANDGEFNRLDGKKLMKMVSERTRIETDRLVRLTAKKLELDDLPDNTENFLQTAKANA